MRKDILTEVVEPPKNEELTFKEMVDTKVKKMVDAINEYMPESFRLREDEFRQRFRDGNRLSRLLADDTGIMNEVAIEALNERLKNENIGDQDRAIIEGLRKIYEDNASNN